MQQLSGLDASFLYLETSKAPMHISSLVIYDPSTAPGGRIRFKQIIEHTAHRIERLPTLSRRLLTVPLGLDHPYWVSDGGFDPEFHIRHIGLPAPGDWRQLCIQVARLHARPLDRDHPLWEMYVIEGLDGIEGIPPGSFAIFTKVHHAAIDGASGMELLAAMHDLTPEPVQPEGAPPAPDDETPSLVKLLWRAQWNTLRQPLRFISVARNTVPGFARAYVALRRGDLRRVSGIPRTRFNACVSPHRVFDAALLPLPEVKAIKDGVPGATVNDVAIAIVGGALRQYLDAKGELPTASLAAMAPINVRRRADGGGGNVISQMTVPVCSHVADPLERLYRVCEGTRAAKQLTRAIGAKTMTDYTQFIPSTLTAQAARLVARLHLTNQISPMYNCVITNVPGPQVPLYNAGCRVVRYYGAGPVLDSVGLFHLVSSYCGMLTISVTSCREMLPDPGFYAQCLRDSFTSLQAAVAEQSAPPKRVPPKKRAVAATRARPPASRAAGKERGLAGRGSRSRK